MASREALYIYARSVAYSWAGMKREDQLSFLKEMYDKTLLERPVNWTLDTGYGTNMDALRERKWLRKDGRPGGTSISAEGTMWCGIFATYCLRAIGIPAQWTLFKGITVPEGIIERRSGYFNHKDIGPGDICVVQENQHHFIVHDRKENTLFSSDGNLDGQIIGERTYNIEKLLEGVKKQAEYDSSIRGMVSPDKTKYSFFYYRLL